MVPPKKDAFADLFQSAAGSSKTQPSLQNLSLKENLGAPKQPASTWNFDILTPTNQSPGSSKPATPSNAQASLHRQSPLAPQPQRAPDSQKQPESDPFAIFGTEAQPKGTAKEDPFAFFTDPVQPSTTARVAAPQPQTSRQDALLDDDFTDAFVAEPKAETRPPTNRAQPREPPSDFRIQETELRDSVLAALVGDGVSLEAANRAVSRVGPDYGKCLEYISAAARSRPSSRPEQKPTPSPQKELGEALHELSADVYKKASWLFDKSKNTVIKNISNYQQRTRGDSGMPAWIKSQHQYKGQAAELKDDGTRYEDFGTDEDNINAEEIQRIVRMQRQRETARQRERLEHRSSPNSEGSESSRVSERPPPQPQRPQVQKANSQTAEVPDVRDAPRKASSKPAPAAPAASKPATPQNATDSVDLLGLGAPLSRAEKFKSSGSQDSIYVSKSRRRAATSSPRAATAEQLNAFQQSDYDTAKAKGAESFSNGDFGSALEAYTKCLESLPPKHELRIVISANLALTSIKLGDYKLARDSCDSGMALIGDCIEEDWTISEKPARYWYTRLLSRKAESLEMLENFESSLECYMALVSKYGVNDKKTMDAKRRVNNIVNPKPQPKKVAAKPTSAPLKSEKLDRVKKQHLQEKLQEEQKFKLHDQVHERTQQWSHGKEDNLRSLLMSLGDVLPQRLGFSFLQKPITINDLMLTKKVKINYMKVISSIHPDKLGALELEDQMVCQAVFVALNKAWDAFKEQNNIA